MKTLRCVVPFLCLAVLSGCGWWDAEEQVEPAALVTFTAERQINKRWSVKVGDGAGSRFHELTPAVLGSRIYVADLKGQLRALERDSGSIIWSRALGADVGSAVGLGDGKVLVTTLDGRVHAFKALDGEPLWSALLSSESVAPPQSTASVVLVQTIDGRLTALSPQSGEQLWSYNAQIPSLSLRGTSTPVLTDQVSFAGFANGKVVAIDNRNGSPLWEQRVAIPEGRTELERMVDIDGELLLSDGNLYISSYQGRLAAISAVDGRLLWHKPLSSFKGVSANLLQVFASDDQGYVRAFEKGNGLEYWKQEALFYRQTTAPAVVKNTVAVADYQGYVHFMSAQDGHFVARTQLDSSGIRGPMLVVDDVLYVYGNSGRLTALTID